MPGAETQKLLLLLLSVKALRERFNQELEALEVEIERLLPPEEQRQPARFIEDWREYMRTEWIDPEIKGE